MEWIACPQHTPTRYIPRVAVLYLTWQGSHLYGVSHAEGTMYGMLLESVQHFLQQDYGEQRWGQVLATAGLHNAVFSTHRRYDDDVMTRLAGACAVTLGGRDKDQFMAYFGRCFVDYFTHYGYDTIMRVSGRHYRDFLNGIDNLHETMRFSYPRMLSPSFYVSSEDRNGCILHYRSQRLGFSHYVIGQLKQCGVKFYNVNVDAKVISEKISEKGCHIVYRLNFDNQAFRPPKYSDACQEQTEFKNISAATFFKVFPFSMFINKDNVITQAGATVCKMFGDIGLIGHNIIHKFILRRPQMEFTWEKVLCLQKVVFEFESIHPVHYQSGRHESSSGNLRAFSCKRVSFNTDDDGHLDVKPTRTLLLRGEMRYMKDIQVIAFLCTPLLSNLEELHETGLYLHDLNMYDSSRDMVMAGDQHASRLEYSIEEQVEKSRLISHNLHQLDQWRQRSEALLYSMIPQQIAVRLKNGEDPINTCEVFDQVTIMFGYILGFNEMCAEVSPMGLVECINSVFTIFDAVVDRYRVFKVETLGDAVYMVAGGVPDRRPNHAYSVASAAIEIVNKVQQIKIPTRGGEQLQIRVGMHTGSVVAGVVGMRTPQYCLFGDTVNTASRMQSYSEPGLIHISEPCQRCLKGSDFVTVFRGRVNIKGKGQMNTYWLAGRRADDGIRQRCHQLRQQHSLTLQQDRSLDSFDLRRVRKQSEVCLFELAAERLPSTSLSCSHLGPSRSPSSSSLEGAAAAATSAVAPASNPVSPSPLRTAVIFTLGGEDSDEALSRSQSASPTHWGQSRTLSGTQSGTQSPAVRIQMWDADHKPEHKDPGTALPVVTSHIAEEPTLCHGAAPQCPLGALTKQKEHFVPSTASTTDSPPKISDSPPKTAEWLRLFSRRPSADMGLKRGSLVDLPELDESATDVIGDHHAARSLSTAPAISDRPSGTLLSGYLVREDTLTPDDINLIAMDTADADWAYGRDNGSDWALYPLAGIRPPSGGQLKQSARRGIPGCPVAHFPTGVTHAQSGGLRNGWIDPGIYARGFGEEEAAGEDRPWLMNGHGDDPPCSSLWGGPSAEGSPLSADSPLVGSPNFRPILRYRSNSIAVQVLPVRRRPSLGGPEDGFGVGPLHRCESAAANLEYLAGDTLQRTSPRPSLHGGLVGTPARASQPDLIRFDSVTNLEAVSRFPHGIHNPLFPPAAATCLTATTPRSPMDSSFDDLRDLVTCLSPMAAHSVPAAPTSPLAVTSSSASAL